MQTLSAQWQLDQWVLLIGPPSTHPPQTENYHYAIFTVHYLLYLGIHHVLIVIICQFIFVIQNYLFNEIHVLSSNASSQDKDFVSILFPQTQFVEIEWHKTRGLRRWLNQCIYYLLYLSLSLSWFFKSSCNIINQFTLWRYRPFNSSSQKDVFIFRWHEEFTSALSWNTKTLRPWPSVA